MVHRDSLWVKQLIQSPQSLDGIGTMKRNKKYHSTQWLTFGKGIVHELVA
jgi:hypothetical protein